MPLIDDVADLLRQTATVLRVIGDTTSFPVADDGATQREYVPFAFDVPCKVFLFKPRSKGLGDMSQAMYGMLNTLGTGALFFLDAPIQTGDRLVVDGVTYMITFNRTVYADDGPSHLIAEVERVAVAPYLDPAGAA